MVGDEAALLAFREWGRSQSARFCLLLLEGLRGRPLPERFQAAFLQSGFVFLVGLSVVLIVKDTSQLPAVQQLLAR